MIIKQAKAVVDMRDYANFRSFAHKNLRRMCNLSPFPSKEELRKDYAWLVDNNSFPDDDCDVYVERMPDSDETLLNIYVVPQNMPISTCHEWRMITIRDAPDWEREMLKRFLDNDSILCYNDGNNVINCIRDENTKERHPVQEEAMPDIGTDEES
jgi:hypothetical protein